MKQIFSALSVAALLGGAATVAHAQDVGPTPPVTEEAAPQTDPLDPNASDTLPPANDELSPAPPADTVQPVDPDDEDTLPADDLLDQQDDTTVTQDSGFGDPADSTLDHGAGHAGDEVEADSAL